MQPGLDIVAKFASVSAQRLVTGLLPAGQERRPEAGRQAAVGEIRQGPSGEPKILGAQIATIGIDLNHNRLGLLVLITNPKWNRPAAGPPCRA